LRAESPKSLGFDAYQDFVDLPGAEKKFGAAYDAVSGRYYICSNPVLPIHRNDLWLRNKPALIRNTAALISSSDLHHWNVEKIFLYSPDLHHEAFQYLNFEFDGEDLAIVSRTAFVVGGHKPPRGHDSNLLTFHRIRDFRKAVPDHELEIDSADNRVLRYERTACERAPLGDFTLGTLFDGAPLQHPVGLAQDAAGRVYIHEEGGRILQFDAAGNYLGLSPSPPLPFVSPCLSVTQPDAAERTWTGSCSEAWETLDNWYYWGRSDTPEELAILSSACPGRATVRVGRIFQIRGIRFCNAAGYTVVGPGMLTIGIKESEGLLEAISGQHKIQVSLLFLGNVRMNTNIGAELAFECPVNVEGRSLFVSGEGQLKIQGAFSLGGGRMVLSTSQSVGFGNTSPQFSGILEVHLPEGLTPVPGNRFELFKFSTPPSGTFNEINLPELAGGLDWDTSMLYKTGAIEVMSAPK
jgi:hypothetical protein